MYKFPLVNTRRFLILAVAALPGSGFSQTPETGGDAKKEVKKQVRFVCTGIAEGTPETLKLLGRSGLQDVALSTRSPGELHAVPADGVIRLGLDSGDPEKPVNPLALGKLPENVNRATALLVARPEKPDGTKYALLLIDDSKLKGGSVYFLNMTKGRAVVKLDGEQLDLPLGKPVIFRPKEVTKGRNSPIAIMVETYDDGKKGWRPLMSSTWRLRSTRIEVCIVYWNEEYKRPSIKGLTLFPMSNESRSE
ncbi:MAG: hypothetical protein H7A51_19900 [Akkermansiaceae bacterium]|nr:hypothetical protein [Akkermansiaceae bacterium]